MQKTIINSMLSALFVVLIIVGAYIAIPMPNSGVPIVLQNMFILLAGLLLKRNWAIITIITYLILGSLGLPVFAGGKGSIAHFYGPTGGFLISYLPAVFIISLISGLKVIKTKRVILDSIALLAGIAVIYILGIPWLAYRLPAIDTLQKALAVGFYPYIGFDILKAAACVAIAKFIRPVIENAFEE